MTASMRTTELRRRIECADYTVEPMIVAEAMLRHALSYRRWWNPIVLCRIPAADIATPGVPSVTNPIHVSDAAASAALRSPGATQMHSS